tara:strand:- start:6018 stop:7136 length:1119 start_codon:yes stop_codon:yes gene_type:complete
VHTDNVSDHPYDGNAIYIINKVVERNGWILDCGSGFRSFTHDRLIQVEIVDYPNVDVLAVNQLLPFKDATFDAIFSLDVLEHVDNPFDSAAEIKRVLKPGGILYVDIPFLQAEHGYPHHYFNATRQGLLSLFNNELELEGHVVPAAGHPMAVLHQFLTTYIKHLPAKESKMFSRMSVKDLIEKSYAEWMKDPVASSLSEEGRWELASTTQAIFRKPDKEEGDTSAPNFLVQNLPGFSMVPMSALSFFDEGKYMELYIDIKEAAWRGQVDPWIHFVIHGLGEGRSPAIDIPIAAFESDPFFEEAISNGDWMTAAKRIDSVAPFLRAVNIRDAWKSSKELVYPEDFHTNSEHPIISFEEAKDRYPDLDLSPMAK